MKTITIGLLLLVLSGSASAQSTGTINGRVTDQSGLALPGTTVTATHTATGVVRTTVSNTEGLYSLPALQPGVYDVVVELAGFGSQAQRDVTLVTGTTISLDFALGVAAVEETVTVTGGAPLVETTQSSVSASLQLTEVQNLPMLNRTFQGLVQLVPGARPAPIINSTRLTFGGGISVAGGGGRNVGVLVDGGDNRDDVVGGPLHSFTLEGIQEFTVLTHRFSAQYGRTTGAVLQVATKSGTNEVHGSAFGFGRNDAMTAIDHFTDVQGLPKTPYDRLQFGGSLGGPIIKDRWFAFGAVERVRQNSTLTLTNEAFNQAEILARALPSLGVIPARLIPQPLRDTMHTLKTDLHLNSNHSFFVRWAHQRQTATNDQFLATNVNNRPHPDLDPVYSNQQSRHNLYSLVASETSIIGSRAVNTVSFQRNHYFTRQWCDCGTPSPFWVLRNLQFPGLEVGRILSSADQIFFQTKTQVRDDFSYQHGKHSLKFGGDFGFYPGEGIGLILNIGVNGATNFFDDPSTIVNNTNGRYPQGFLTPGAVSSVTLGTGTAGGPDGRSTAIGQKELGVYLQDDWAMTSRLTMNLGVRYDLALNAYNEKEQANNRTYVVLRAINSRYASDLPHAPTKNISPRVGFAWDITGDSRNVLKAGAGIFFDRMNTVLAFQPFRLMKPTLSLASTYVNTAVGVGQLANYVFGVSPLPPGPPALATELPPGANTTGALLSPDMTDSYSEQFNIGYTRQLTNNTVFAADYTHILGLHEPRSQQINPIEGPWNPNQGDVPTGTRRLAPAFQRVLGDPTILGGITLYNSDGRSRFDELIFSVDQRAPRVTFRASYTLAWAYAWGGVIQGAPGGGGIATSRNSDLQFGPGEWGPAATDERHRVVLSGIFELPWGVQAAPVFQFGSARPYTLTAGTDVNRDGTNNDLYIDPATGQQVAVNSARGTATWNLDARLTKFFVLGAQGQRIGVFAELYNLTNRANFGNLYNGNGRSATFQQPVGYIVGYPTSRQLQIGARFTF